MKLSVASSKESHAHAEKRAREEGSDSIAAYLDALIEEDKEAASVHDWMQERIRKGLASPSAGELTRSKLNRLVREGIARVAAKA
jgi:hypothetical protein